MVITANYIFVFIIALIFTVALAFIDAPTITKKYGEKKHHQWRNIITTILVLAIVYLCYLNFPVSLTLLVFGTGIIYLIDILFFAKKRHARKHDAGVLVKNSREFFPVLLLVWVIRSFIIQPYHVPSGSLEPTVLTGDFIAAKQYAYGLRFPIGNFTMIPTGKPQEGDIVLFYNPVNPQVVFIKRVIGIPGDHVVYKNKVLYINGIEQKQQFVEMTQDIEPGYPAMDVERRTEILNGIKHDIFVWPSGGETQDYDLIVPDHMYFMMGDNRDNSDDGRTGFGSGTVTFVPEQNLIGKAFLIWMSWDGENHRMRWNRIGHGIH